MKPALYKSDRGLAGTRSSYHITSKGRLQKGDRFYWRTSNCEL